MNEEQLEKRVGKCEEKGGLNEKEREENLSVDQLVL